MKRQITILFALVVVLVQTRAQAQSISVPLPTTATIGTVLTVNLTAEDAKGNLNDKYTGTTTVTTTDKAAIIPSSSVTFTSGKAVIEMAFMTTGTQTLSIKDATTPLSGQANTNVVTASTAALAGCSSCYASLGAGAVLANSKFGDYNDSSNVLQTTHLGASTPQYVAGVAYKIAIRGALYKKLSCNTQDFTIKRSDAQVAFCYPYKVFVNLKFSPDSSQTFNGFTYGISHALHQYLDLMIGISYSAHNEISPGFLQTALSVVKTQQAAGNPYYSQYNLAALKANDATAFDGFPTQLINANGTAGSLIYTGSPTVLHYHSGFFMGVAIPLSFKSPASGN